LDIVEAWSFETPIHHRLEQGMCTIDPIVLRTFYSLLFYDVVMRGKREIFEAPELEV